MIITTQSSHTPLRVSSTPNKFSHPSHTQHNIRMRSEGKVTFEVIPSLGAIMGGLPMPPPGSLLVQCMVDMELDLPQSRAWRESSGHGWKRLAIHVRVTSDEE